jgi:hypothetical protein
MATFLVVWAVAVIAALFLLIDGLIDLEKSVGPWDAAMAGHPARLHRPARRSDTRRAHDRRYHIVDYPLHRRRSDDTGGES